MAGSASWCRAGAGRLVLDAVAGATNSDLPQDRIRAGRPVTGPGYGFHQLDGHALLSQRVEWQVPIAFPSIPLGRWGRTPGEARLAPFGSVIAVRDRGADGRIRVQGFPGVGVGLIAFHDLLRADVARGLRDGRWRFG